MKIGFVISSLSSGGAERVMAWLANALCERHCVFIVVLEDNVFYPLKENIQYIVCSNPKGSLKAISKRLLNLRLLLKKHKPDIIISFMTQISVMTLLVSFGLNIPIIVSEHTDPFGHKLPSKFNLLRKILYPFAYRVICLQKEFCPFYKNALVIPNKIEINDPIKDYKPIAQKIIVVGRLSKEKNHTSFIWAMRQVVERYPNTQAFIYGQGEEENNLRALIETLKLSHNVFLSGVTHNILDKLRKSDLFVSTSLYEGFGLSIAEAMSVGLPVICTNTLGNIVPYEGVSIDDASALAHRICHLIPNQEEREKLGRLGREEVKKYNSQDILSLWEEIILESQHI